MDLNRTIWTAALAFVAATTLAGCSQWHDYMDRKDTIDFSAGNAVNTNVVAHMIDPWPPHARNKNIAFSGERMQRAVHRYNCGPGAAAGGSTNGGGTSITINNAPQSAATPSNC